MMSFGLLKYIIWSVATERVETPAGSVSSSVTSIIDHPDPVIWVIWVKSYFGVMNL